MIARLTNMLAALVFVVVSALHMGMVLRDGAAGQYAAAFALTGLNADISDVCGLDGSNGIDPGHCPFCNLSAHFISPEPPVLPIRMAGEALLSRSGCDVAVVSRWRWYLPEARGSPLLA